MKKIYSIRVDSKYILSERLTFTEAIITIVDLVDMNMLHESEEEAYAHYEIIDEKNCIYFENGDITF